VVLCAFRHLVRLTIRSLVTLSLVIVFENLESLDLDPPRCVAMRCVPFSRALGLGGDFWDPQSDTFGYNGLLVAPRLQTRGGQGMSNVRPRPRIPPLGRSDAYASKLFEFFGGKARS